MKIYKSKPNGGWVADKDGLPGSVSQTDAATAGFKPHPPASATEYVLVATSHQKGFRGRLAKTYYSVWGK